MIELFRHRLQTLDSCLCLVLFFPSMLFYWRGIWDLFGVYIFPKDEPKGHWVTAGLGACSIVGYYALPLLSRLLLPLLPDPASNGGGGGGRRSSSRRVVYVIFTRLYLYAFGVLSMAYWKGVWSLADYYLLEFGWKAGLIGLVVCHTILLLLRSTRTTIFPPFVVTLDTRKDLFVPSTCFQTQVIWTRPSSVIKYSLDSLLTQYVVMTAAVVTWRSSFNLLDIFVFPDDALLSNVSCFLIGVTGSIVLFGLETPLRRLLASHFDRTQRSYWLLLAVEDAIYVVVFAVESFLWRGGWNLNATFIISDPLVGGWVNHSIGTVLLMSLQLLSYAAGCGCARDGQDANSEDAVYATKYLRAFDVYLQEKKENERNGVDQKRQDGVDDDDEENVRNEKEKKSLVKGDDAFIELTDLCPLDSAHLTMSTIVNADQSATRIL